MEVTAIQSWPECQSEEMDSEEERRLLGLDEQKPQRLPKEKKKGRGKCSQTTTIWQRNIGRGCPEGAVPKF